MPELTETEERLGIEHDGFVWVAYRYSFGPNYRVTRERINASHTEEWLRQWLSRLDRDERIAAERVASAERVAPGE